MISILDRMAR
jgi:sulfite reductase alpha subunit-like flavoprotein